jgi:hypothetical protein
MIEARAVVVDRQITQTLMRSAAMSAQRSLTGVERTRYAYFEFFSRCRIAAVPPRDALTSSAAHEQFFEFAD